MKIKEQVSKVIINEEVLKNIKNDLEDILKKLNNCLDFNEEKELIIKFNNVRDNYLTLYWISYIGYLKDTKNEKYLETEKIMGKYEPIINNLIYDYYKVLISSKNKEKLKKFIGKRALAIANNQARLKSDDVVFLQTKEKELCFKYQKLIIGTKFNFLDKEINLSSLNTYYNDDNRYLRKKAYDKRFEILESLEKDIDIIIDELIDVRNSIAKTLGFNSYSEMSFVKMNRLGYSKDDLYIFKEEIKKYVVPLFKLLKEQQKERLGLEKLEYYDSNYLFKDGNAKVRGNLEDILENFKTVLKKYSKVSYNLLCMMLDEGLIDLDNRENKANGGITTYIPNYKVPLFIKKYMGLESNITSIFHEFGHSNQLYLSKDLLFHENRWPTFDICEIHSTSMEYLMYPFMDLFFGSDDYKYKIKHLTNSLSLMVNMAIADDFWSCVYDDNLDSEERKKKWLEIREEYNLDSYDTEYFNRGTEYQADTNRIIDPFYTIDYAIDNVLALSFYKKEKENIKETFDLYTKLCKDGGTLSLKEIIRKYNLDNPFEKDALKDMCDIIKEDIKVLSLRRK